MSDPTEHVEPMRLVGRGGTKMRLPAFVVAAGIVGASVVAFLLPVHDNYSVRCPGQGAVGAIQADASGYVAPDLSVQSVPGFDASAANAQILANEQAVITSKVRACHDSGETRLLIAGAILAAAVIGSRFVPDVAQREQRVTPPAHPEETP